VKHKRRKQISRALSVVGALWLYSTAAAAVPLAENLSSDGQQAELGCKPLLLEFSATTCSYCELLETEVLNPTLLDRTYDQRVLMRKVVIDGANHLTDFDGKETVSADQLARRYKVQVTPTLVFVDAQGRELSKRMIGVTTLDFYGAYLDAALDDSRRQLRTRNQCDAKVSLLH